METDETPRAEPAYPYAYEWVQDSAGNTFAVATVHGFIHLADGPYETDFSVDPAWAMLAGGNPQMMAVTAKRLREEPAETEPK